jgi:hypothetical protein
MLVNFVLNDCINLPHGATPIRKQRCGAAGVHMLEIGRHIEWSQKERKKERKTTTNSMAVG